MIDSVDSRQLLPSSKQLYVLHLHMLYSTTLCLFLPRVQFLWCMWGDCLLHFQCLLKWIKCRDHSTSVTCAIQSLLLFELLSHQPYNHDHVQTRNFYLFFKFTKEKYIKNSIRIHREKARGLSQQIKKGLNCPREQRLQL